MGCRKISAKWLVDKMLCFRSRFSICLVHLIYLVPDYNAHQINGWNYLNLHCRDNDNKPVEWWYIYKPPSDDVPFMEMGRNFTYITSLDSGRWRPSDRYITSNSMLQHTLSPIFRPTYVDYLAVVVYESRSSTEAFGILMADERGGVWITHSVPGLVNINDDHHTFPDEERINGHLLMCLSVDLLAVNEIASTIKTVEPKLTYVKIAKKLDELLPMWDFSRRSKSGEKRIKKTAFLTSEESLRVEIYSRPPNNGDSLYKTFATSKRIILDTYSQSRERLFNQPCNANSSVRGIQGISLKLHEWVHYIRKGVDKSKFAVSTAAPWQKMRSWPPQYWTCVSNLDAGEKRTQGGLIACVDDYSIWLTFDNLKIKEPEC